MSTTALTPTVQRAESDRRRWLRSRDNSLIVVLVCFCLIVGALNPVFLSWSNVALILSAAAVLGLVALGEFLVIVTGAVDISVGAIVGISALTTGLVLDAGWPLALSVGAGLAAAALAGTLNGTLVALGGIPSVIVTLATLSLFRWGLQRFTGGDSTDAAQRQLSWLTTPGALKVPPSVLLLFAAAILLSVFVGRTQLGREIFAVGANEAAARASGVAVKRVRVIAFTLAGFFAGLGGIVAASQLAYVSAQTGSGLEFLAIGAVVLGGTNLFGGSGRVRGVVTGALLLYAIYNAMVILGVPAAWQDAVAGALILVAVIFDTLGRRRGK